ncbi:hypothetical protein Anas_10544 [Armadillidium nasatum]|uniref:H15 domain-containing protein n=1 Tax=Armadillidium nasatum TaxID=96803 RepID=A0A5N5TFC9_9CRUS|nr:hypothetical protein Anas_10544 [Armadillidium nasatum]
MLHNKSSNSFCCLTSSLLQFIMSDAVVTTAPAAPKATKKAPKEKKVKKSPTHPKYSSMISDAIKSLKERSGSSRQAIVKYIVANFKIDEKTASTQVKLALKRGDPSDWLKADAEAKPKKAAVKKTKKPTAKKPSTKKPAAKRSPVKKSKAKKPAKKSAKP